MRFVWLLPLLLCTFSGVAQAQSNIWEEHTVVEPPQEKRLPRAHPGPFEQKPVALLAHLGVGTPYGLVGFSGAYSFIAPLALEAGLGTNAMGVQLATKLHWRFTPERNNTGFIALGYSQGRHVQDEGRLKRLFSSLGHDETKYLPRTWAPARWFDFEGGYGHQSKSGFTLRCYGGVAALLNSEEATGEEPPIDGPSNETVEATSVSTLLPYVGVSVGQAF